MSETKGSHLFVNLSPSQTRRRLKSFGHGVRKIQSAGTNKAVIIHTATGRHLEELQAKFADVGFSSQGDELSEPVENLRNLGPASAGWLRDAGIHTVEDLRRFGPALAYRMVIQKQPEASLNLLWAIAAGLQDRDWRELTGEEKEQLVGSVEE